VRLTHHLLLRLIHLLVRLNYLLVRFSVVLFLTFPASSSFLGFQVCFSETPKSQNPPSIPYQINQLKPYFSPKQNPEPILPVLTQK
jgi:hypothetical protein